MARIRTVKPEFWSNEQVAQCCVEARLLFLGLLNFCDDGGVHQASAHRLKSEVLPGDSFTTAQVASWMDELLRVGLVSTYEAEGKSYWYITGWHHQKIDKPTYSLPGSKELGEKAVQYRKNLLEKTEKPRRDLGEESSSSRRDLVETSATERKGKESNGVESKGKDDNCPEAPSKPRRQASKFSLGVEHHIWPYFVTTGPASEAQAKWVVTEADIDEWSRAYPGVNVRTECFKAHSWVKANWRKRKTFTGYPAFFIWWLSGAQNKHPPRDSTNAPQRQPAPAFDFASESKTVNVPD